MTTVYLSGAIKNDKNHKLKFTLWKNVLTNLGAKVLTPISTKAYKSKKQNIKDCLFASIMLMQKADYIIQLDDPAISKGMQIEEAIADYCNIKVIKKQERTNGR